MILGIETSTALCSVALFDKEGLHYIKEDEGPQSHSALLTVMIGDVLKDAGMTVGDLEGVFFSDGPGSYTGLRIGASVAKSLCYVRNLPLYACSGLAASAREGVRQAIDSDYFIGLMDARREDVYAIVMDKKGQIIKEPHLGVISKDLLPYTGELHGRVALCGSGRTKVAQYDLPENFLVTDIGHSAGHLRAMWLDQEKMGLERPYMTFEPYYMQRPNITTPKRLWFTPS
jgi:tRNA threonylcarbamoyladenosine biosynthesis protein TsaB